MNAIYAPTGRALEYSLLALNLYKGCSHGCDYCFVPNMPWRTAEKFLADTEPRAGIIEQLRKDAPKFAGTDERVLRQGRSGGTPTGRRLYGFHEHGHAKGHRMSVESEPTAMAEDRGGGVDG